MNGQVRGKSCQLRLIRSSMVHAASRCQVAAEDVGDLPVKIEFDVQLFWDEAALLAPLARRWHVWSDICAAQTRTAILRHRLIPQSPKLRVGHSD